MVAICMATYEPPPELFRRQIESIRGQSHGNWVCLIGDDGSSPQAFKAIEALVQGDSRFRLQRNPRRLGVYGNFERLLESVPKEAGLIALADQDDRWQPEKLERLIERIGPGMLLAYSDARLVDAHGRLISPTFWTARRNNPDDLSMLMIANSITGAASLLRRELLDVALPFPDPALGLMHDHWLAMMAMSLGEVAYVDRPLYDYVQHGGAALGHESERRRGQGSDRMRRGHELGRAIAAAAALVLERGGERIPASKRRELQRLAHLQRSPAAWGRLAWMTLREPVRGTHTLGAERFLLAGLVWGATQRGATRLGASEGGDAYPLDWRPSARLRRRLRRSVAGRGVGRIADLGLEARQRALGIGRELDALAAEGPRRDVLVLGIYGGDGSELTSALRELRESVHNVRVVLGSMGGAAPQLVADTALTGMHGGKFANLNRLAEVAEPLAADWLLLVDDDIRVGRHFLDRLVIVAERFGLSLAQPALSRASYGWWSINRRRPALVRETRFVEIGPLLLIRRDAYRVLAPFPEEGMGWGLCLHWGAVARRQGWRLGVVDAVPVRHESRRTASAIDVEAARAAAERLLAGREHLSYAEAETVLARHSRMA